MIIVILISIVTPIGLINKKNSSFKRENQGKIYNSAAITNTKDWIKNGNFTSDQYWNSTKGALGDPTDVSASINVSAEVANFVVLGDIKTYSNINGTPTASKGWTKTINPFYPTEPNQAATLTAYGAYARHYWSEGADQQVSVQWEKNIYMSHNMSDYTITSASLNITVNGTVEAFGGSDDTPTTGHGIEVAGDDTSDQADHTSGDQYSTGDFIRFYVTLADINKNKNYSEVVVFQNTTLGTDSAGNSSGTLDYMYNHTVEVDDENDLIFILNNLFHNYNNYNLTMTIGIRINCEDNFYYDDDDFEDIYITSADLSFTYMKRIDRDTSISWDQEGDNPNAIIANLTTINQAILNFTYNSSATWSSSSPNSEIKIKINEIFYPETIKLSEVDKTIKEASFDITSLIRINIDKEINLSIVVNLADDFELNQTFTISIDNVTLEITYTQNLDDIPTKLHLFLDKTNMTDDPDPGIEIPLGENLNITVKYMNLTSQHIPVANIQLEGKVNNTLPENDTYYQYTAIINTSKLGIGVKI